jgi:hypothetical protein
MFFKRNKFKKLKREDVVAAIVELENREAAIVASDEKKQIEIDQLKTKGKAETDRSRRLFYAKKISSLESERAANLKRAEFLLYNIKQLRRLKDAVEDKEFIEGVGAVPLNDLLGDPAGLSAFLNKALSSKMLAEQNLVGAEDVFDDVDAQYEPEEKIYGVSQSDDELLAIFEQSDITEDEIHAAEAAGTTANKSED